MLDGLEFSGEIIRRMGRLSDRHPDPEDRRFWNRVWGIITWFFAIGGLVGAVAWKPALLVTVIQISNYIQQSLLTSGVEPNQTLVTALLVLVSAGGLMLMIVAAAFGVAGVIAAIIGISTHPKVKQFDKSNLLPETTRKRKSGAARR